MNPDSETAQRHGSGNEVGFLWLELTNRCNLECVHCYADSGPAPATEDLLTADDYRDTLAAAARLGCRQVQFVGGEPTLNRELPALISAARDLGYEFVEVFTNLTSLRADVLAALVEHRTRVATSVYSYQAEVHDGITRRRGSFARTLHNLARVRDAGLPLRVGVIGMPQNRGQVAATVEYLHAQGIDQVGTDEVRAFGRALGADHDHAGTPSMANLCGKCAGTTLCVAPDGGVSPCIMSKTWSVGSILDEPLPAIVASERMRAVRAEIAGHQPSVAAPSDDPVQANCEPYCAPSCYPSCVPACAPSCAPSCVPYCAPSCVPSAPR